MIRIRTLLCAASAACGLALGINASAATLSLSVDACDSFSMSPQGVITCNTSGGAGPVASCSLTPDAPSVAIGSSKTLTMNCSNMGGAISYAWTGCAPSGNTCSVTQTQVGPVPVSVTASAGVNNISKSTTVTFFDPSAGGGGGGAGIPTTCSDGTKVVSTTINAFDGQPVSLAIGSGTSQTGIFKVVVPQGAGPNISLVWLRSGGTTDGTPAVAYVSKTACDMPSQHRANGSYPSQQWSFGTSSTTLNGLVDGLSTIIRGNLGDVLHMAPGDVWYLMFQNKDSRGSSTCKSGTCAVVIKPNTDR
ncbi:MAG: hypothetical protein ABI881_04945 [Betaproteobacteria bacterium]